MTEFTWDGFDRYGRELQSVQNADVEVSYVYDGVYGNVANDFFLAVNAGFGRPGTGVSIEGSQTRGEIYLRRTWNVPVGTWSPGHGGLGGWTLNVHHAYAPNAHRLLLGDGSTRDALLFSEVVKNVGGENQVSPSNINDGADARLANVNGAHGVAVGPDGAIYIAQSARVRRIAPSGIINTIAGTGTLGFTGDGGPATSARIWPTGGLAVAPDGTVYIADRGNHRVRRVGTDGIITTFAGNGSNVSSGDHGWAVNAGLADPWDVATAPDGSVYVAEQRYVRRIDVNGVITTVAGNGLAETTTQLIPNQGPALAARLSPRNLAFGPDGTLYILHQNHTSGGPYDRIYSLGTDGVLRRVIGCRVPTCTRDAGNDATAFQLWGTDLTVGDSGQLYFFARETGASTTGSIMTVGADGVVRRAYGGQAKYRSGELAASVVLRNETMLSLDLGPDGLVYTSETLLPNSSARDVVTRIARATVGIAPGQEVTIPSEDGAELYIFSSSGRHLRTLHALTRAPLYTFDYDGQGLLVSVTDEVGRVTSIERDGNGAPLAVVDPYGRETLLTVGDDGFLETVTSPADETYTLGYHADGLLVTLTNPRGGNVTATYDADGRIISDEDAAGGELTFSRVDEGTAWTVTKTTALGRTTTYESDRRGDGSRARFNTFPNGLGTLEERATDQSTEVLFPDGTETESSVSADPRWGINAPVTSTRTRLPSGLERVTTQTRTSVLGNPLDPATLTSLTETNVVNGRSHTATYTASTRTWNRVSPEGRAVRQTLDALGRVSSTRVGTLLPVNFLYDSDGRLAQVQQGSRVSTFDYFDTTDVQNGFLESITNALFETTNFTRDAAGRVLTETYEDGAQTAFGWDAHGNLASVTPPDQPVHTQSYTPVDLLASYTPPTVAGVSVPETTHEYDLDRMLTIETRPDGTEIEWTYDTAGREDTLTIPTGVVDYDYDPATGDLQSITGPGNIALDFTYDGQLQTGSIWSGDVAGSIGWTFNDDFLPISETVTAGSSSSTATFAYDDDSLMTCSSPSTCTPVGSDAMQVTYDTAGLMNGVTFGDLTETYTHNAFGELATHTVAFDGTPIFSMVYDDSGTTGVAPRDDLGRIVRRSETVLGTPRNLDYSYDERGRLIGVAEGLTVLSEYDYDDNGNRLSHTIPGGTVTATYDDQDRLLSYGDFTFTYGENGELESKTDTATSDTTSYVYDARGSLLSVTLPDTTLIEYVVDGQGRRVGKKVDGALAQGFLYKDQLRIAAELDATGEVAAHFSYVGGSHSPDWMTKAGELYRLVKDQVGSIRLVVNALTGDVAQELEYDEFGVVTSDSNPGFQPFGFAGGLYDGDTGLTRFGARDYDAEVGRWTAKDPIRWEGRQENLFVYAFANPINAVDPGGQQAAVFDYLEAVKGAESLYPDSMWNGAGDAYKHCVASCKVAQGAVGGSWWAELIGWLNELKGDWFNNQPGEERRMDEFNNSCGRAFGSAGEDCTLACRSAAESGALRTLY